MADNKIQITIEALDKTKAAFSELEKSIKGLGDTTASTQRTSSGYLAKMKENWLALSAAVMAGYMTMQKAMQYVELGARAMQAEIAFKKTAESVGANADQMLADMRKASAGTIDDSHLMQKAIKAMAQDVDPNKIPALFEAARVGAVKSGRDISDVADVIIDAIANQMPRGLKNMGMISKNEFDVFNKAVAAGADNLNLLDLVLYKSKIQAAKMGVESYNAAIGLQRFNSEVAELKENLGKGIIEGLDFLLGSMKSIGSVALLASAGIWKLIQAKQALQAAVSWGAPKTAHEEAAKAAGEFAQSDLDYAKGMMTGKRGLFGTSLETFQPKTKAELDADAAKNKSDYEKLMADWKKMGMSKTFIEAQRALMQADIQGIQSGLEVAKEGYKLQDAAAEEHYKAGLTAEGDYIAEKQRLEKAGLTDTLSALEKEKTATQNRYKAMIGAVLPGQSQDEERNKLAAEKRKETARIDGEIAKTKIDLQIADKQNDISAIERKQKLADVTREGVLNLLQEEVKLRTQLNSLKVERGTMTESAATAQEIEGNRSILELQRRQIIEKITAGGLADADVANLKNQVILINGQLYSLQAVTIEKEKQRQSDEKTLEIDRERLVNTYNLREKLAESTGDYQTMYDMQKRSLEIEKARSLLKVSKTYGFTQEDIDAVNRYYADQTARIEDMKTPLGALKRGFTDLRVKWGDESKQMYDLAQSTANGMQQSFSNIFFDSWTGNLQSAGSYLKSFAQTVLRTLANVISEMIVKWILLKTETLAAAESAVAGIVAENSAVLSLVGAYLALAAAKAAAGIAGAAGGSSAGYAIAPTGATGYGGAAGGYHGGGEVGKPAFYRLILNPDLIPRRHGGGLAPDERITINKVGERFVTKEQNDWLSAIARKMEGGETPAPVVKLDIANIVSPDLLDAYLATGRGQNAILNLIASKSGTIKRIMGAS
jgi:hypothetical protein